jgi:hypothetical protein
VLAIMNGYVEQNIISNQNSAFMKNLASKSNMTDQIDYAFQAILQRKPDSREMSDFKTMLKKLSGNDGHKDVAWVLLNSHEFLFVR